MSSALERLTFTVLLLDKLSGPSQSVCASLQKVQAQGRDAFMTIGKGGAAIVASAAALTSLTGPAREFNRALGEVASLGVAQEELDKLGTAGKKFAMQFGGNAAEIVRSGYDIQSAIPGLAKGALAEFTYQGALLAKAGKSNAATITKYQGTMYNIFERDAKRIGEAKWVEQLTGKTAYAIKMFKTTGDEMSSAFSNLGSVGQVSGVSMDEQMAVLGTLQGTMGGANAGTAYKAFLNKIGTAQKALGMSFTDSQGKMLPIVDILEKIKAKVGDGNLSTADATALMQAFGDEGGKAVMNLLSKTDQLKGSIGELSNIQNATGAIKMAESMTDPLERFNSVWGVVRTTLGQSILPIVNAALSVMARVLIAFQWLLDAFPPLRWALAAVAIAVTTMTGAWGMFLMARGAISMMRVIYTELRIVWAWCLRNSAATHSMTLAQRINAVAQMFWSRAMSGAIALCRIFAWQNLQLAGALIWQGAVMAAQKVGMIVYAGALWLLNGALNPVIASVWAFTIALLANPVTWVVLAIVALIGALVALVVYWDDVTAAAVACWDWIVGAATWAWDMLTAGVKAYFGLWIDAWDTITAVAGACWDWIVSAASWVWDMLTAGVEAYFGIWIGAWDAIKAGAQAVFGWLGGVGDWLGDGVDAYLDAWLGVWDAIKAGAQAAFGWISTMWDNTVGLLGKAWTWITGGSEAKTEKIRKEEPVMEAATASRRRTDVAAGGIRSSTTNQTTNYGGVTINTTAFPGPGDIEDYMALQA